jgi:hypothetical protein
MHLNSSLNVQRTKALLSLERSFFVFYHQDDTLKQGTLTKGEGSVQLTSLQ